MSEHAVTHEAHEQEVYAKTVLGFWFFLVTDFLMFATVFASYAVLKNNTFGGPGASELFAHAPALFESFVMLAVAVTAGVGATLLHKKMERVGILFFWIATLLALFVAWLQYCEFSMLIASGNSWTRSAFLSAYFTLVGTHFFHLLIGAFVSVAFLVPVMLYGVTEVYLKRLTCLKMFWMFLNVVWIFIFSFVYLLGVV